MPKIEDKKLLDLLEKVNLRLREDFIESYEGWTEMLSLLNNNIIKGVKEVNIELEESPYNYDLMCEDVLKCADQLYQYLYANNLVWDNQKFYSEIISKISYHKITELIKQKINTI